MLKSISLELHSRGRAKPALPLHKQGQHQKLWGGNSHCTSRESPGSVWRGQAASRGCSAPPNPVPPHQTLSLSLLGKPDGIPGAGRRLLAQGETETPNILVSLGHPSHTLKSNPLRNRLFCQKSELTTGNQIRLQFPALFLAASFAL